METLFVHSGSLVWLSSNPSLLMEQMLLWSAASKLLCSARFNDLTTHWRPLVKKLLGMGMEPVCEETVLDDATVNASGGGNGHLTEQKTINLGIILMIVWYLFRWCRIRILTYTHGRSTKIQFTEPVNIKQELIKLPNLVLTKIQLLREVFAKEQNQYMNEGNSMRILQVQLKDGWSQGSVSSTMVVVQLSWKLLHILSSLQREQMLRMKQPSIGSQINVAFPQPGDEPVRTAPTAQQPLKNLKSKTFQLSSCSASLSTLQSGTQSSWTTSEANCPELEKRSGAKKNQTDCEWHKNNILVTKEEPQPEPFDRSHNRNHSQHLSQSLNQLLATIRRYNGRAKVEENLVSDVVEGERSIATHSTVNQQLPLTSLGLLGDRNRFGLARKKED